VTVLSKDAIVPWRPPPGGQRRDRDFVGFERDSDSFVGSFPQRHPKHQEKRNSSGGFVE
jgi:hypothetical protein